MGFVVIRNRDATDRFATVKAIWAAFVVIFVAEVMSALLFPAKIVWLAVVVVSIAEGISAIFDRLYYCIAGQ